MLLLALAAATGAAAFTPTTDENMNGAYHYSKTPNAPGDLNTNFKV